MTVLDENNFKARHIIAVSGHRSENTVKKYAKWCPEKKNHEMAKSLAVQLSSKKPKVQTVTSDKPNFDLDNYHMQLLPINIDDTDNNLLVQILDETEKQEIVPKMQITQTGLLTNVTNTQHVQNMHVPPNPIMPNMMPQMLFPHSNLAINYNLK